ncbi:hypothetical protein LOD99_7227 [Oopsacas minuta]|uniref:Ribosomal RNA-processing protein 14/surfeit locus protein 6 C-terminal domain-containing protein n=1 Tax=Oopsacas minuta TaxID=111878 RepID=A0AAV7JUQ1_9METZ|nr:hypothetical protein LOD99_7227 [Oopsacas minuta]
MIPLPKLHDDSESDMEIDKGKELKNEKPAVTDINEIVNLSPDKLWEKYQSKLSDLKGSRADTKRKIREKESQKSSSKTKKHKKTPKIAKKPSETKINKDVQFSQLTFKANVDLADIIPKKKNYSKLFIEAEKKQRELKSLQVSDPSKAEEIIETEQWNRAMSRVEGKKQKDDVKKLHKSWKQVQKRKKVSKQRLSERIGLQEKQIHDKQEKRKKHIKERKELKLTNKIKKRRR